MEDIERARPENYYDKPRKASSIVISIFITIAFVLTMIILPFDWNDVKDAVDNTAEGADSAAGAIAGGFVIALFGALAIVLVIVVAVANAINAAICLPFAIKNRRSTLKGIRIYSYVLDGVVGLVLLINLIKAISLIVSAQG